MSPFFCRKRQMSHPTGTRAQNVSTRNTTAMDNAAAVAMPVARKPVDRAPSTAPIPPGVGTAAPTVLPVRKSNATVVGERFTPKAVAVNANANRYPPVTNRLPVIPATSRTGWVTTQINRGHTWRTIGPILVIQQLRAQGVEELKST